MSWLKKLWNKLTAVDEEVRQENCQTVKAVQTKPAASSPAAPAKTQQVQPAEKPVFKCFPDGVPVTAPVISCEGTLLVEEEVEPYADEKYLIVPEGVEEIGCPAFEQCKKLKSVHLPRSLRTIGAFSFQECVCLERIVVPYGVESIESHAFSECSHLKSIDLPGSLRSIAHNAFEKCTSLEEIRLPDTVEVIENFTFDGCERLRKVHLPEKLRVIGDYAFDECTSLQEISFPESLKEIGKYAFSCSDRLTAVRLPEGITALSEDAFHPDVKIIYHTTQNGTMQKNESFNVKNGDVRPSSPPSVSVPGPVHVPAEPSSSSKVAYDRNVNIIFKDKHFVLAGYGTSEKIPEVQTIRQKGGILHSSVIKSADYLIVHEHNLGYAYENKVSKALEWREKGSGIKLISHEDFWRAARSQEVPLVTNPTERTKNTSFAKPLEITSYYLFENGKISFEAPLDSQTIKDEHEDGRKYFLHLWGKSSYMLEISDRIKDPVTQIPERYHYTALYKTTSGICFGEKMMADHQGRRLDLFIPYTDCQAFCIYGIVQSAEATDQQEFFAHLLKLAQSVRIHGKELDLDGVTVSILANLPREARKTPYTLNRRISVMPMDSYTVEEKNDEKGRSLSIACIEGPGEDGFIQNLCKLTISIGEAENPTGETGGSLLHIYHIHDGAPRLLLMQGRDQMLFVIKTMDILGCKRVYMMLTIATTPCEHLNIISDVTQVLNQPSKLYAALWDIASAIRIDGRTLDLGEWSSERFCEMTASEDHSSRIKAKITVGKPQQNGSAGGFEVPVTLSMGPEEEIDDDEDADFWDDGEDDDAYDDEDEYSDANFDEDDEDGAELLESLNRLQETLEERMEYLRQLELLDDDDE